MLSEFRKRYPSEPFVSPADRRTFYMAEQYDRLKPGLAVRKCIVLGGLSIHFMYFRPDRRHCVDTCRCGLLLHMSHVSWFTTCCLTQ